MARLKQIVGFDGKGAEVATPVDSIYVGGMEVGTVGRHPGAPICLFHGLAEAVVDDVRKAVDARDGRAYPNRKVTVPPDATQVRATLGESDEPDSDQG